MSDTKPNDNNADLVLGMLGVAFVVLKLCGVIDWSWWWVTAPFWGGFAAVLVLLVVACIGYAIAKLLDK